MDMTWREQRAALAQVMRPAEFRELARRMPSEAATLHSAQRYPDLKMRLEEIHNILWDAHEHFIAVLFVRMMGPGRVTNQIASVMSDQPRSIEQPQDEQP